MMCYYLNVHFQGQKVKTQPISARKLRNIYTRNFCFTESAKSFRYKDERINVV